MYRIQWIAFKTIVRREIQRVLRIWIQTLLPAGVTSILYYVIFGKIVGRQIGFVNGYTYIQFIAPGLIALNIINNSYSSTVSSFYAAKFQKNIETILVSPVHNLTLLLGYTVGGMVRGLLVGLLVLGIALAFTHLPIYSLLSIVTIALFICAIFSLGGLLNAMFAKSFDDVAFVPNFILTPLTYLGGVFYSFKSLPVAWKYVSLVNPIFYIIDNFRHAFLGTADSHVVGGYLFMSTLLITLFLVTLYCLRIGVGLRE